MARKVVTVMVLMLALGGCGSGSPPGNTSNISLPAPPANSPDITGNWEVYLCGTGSACTPASAGYIGTLDLYISQEPAIYDSFQNRWSSVLDGNSTGGVVGTCVVGNLLSSSFLEWTSNYPAEPASIYIDTDTDTAGANFTMQSSNFTNSGTWQASPECGSGLTSLSGTYQMQQVQ